MNLKILSQMFSGSEERTCRIHDISYKSWSWISKSGSEQWSECPECIKSAEMEKWQREYEQHKLLCKQQALEQIFKKSSIPPKFEKNSFSNYFADTPDKIKAKRTMERFASTIDEQLKIGRNVILSGNPGTGKTHLAVATAKVAMEKGHSALFTTVGDMIDVVHEAGWKKATAIQQYAVPDVLVLDDVSYGLSNEEQKTFFKILNKRSEQINSTIIQTNLSLDDLRHVLGDRNLDRLCENGGLILYFHWGSYRMNPIKPPKQEQH